MCLPFRGNRASVCRGREICLRVGACARRVRDEILKISNAVAVAARCESRAHVSVAFSPPKPTPAKCALPPASPLWPQPTMIEVTSRKLRSAKSSVVTRQSGPGLADDRAVRVDIERRETVRDRALFFRRAGAVDGIELGACHQCAGPEGIEDAPVRARWRVGRRPQRHAAVDDSRDSRAASAARSRRTRSSWMRTHRRRSSASAARACSRSGDFSESSSAGFFSDLLEAVAPARASSRSAPVRATTANSPAASRTCRAACRCPAGRCRLARHSLIASIPANAVAAATRNS